MKREELLAISVTVMDKGYRSAIINVDPGRDVQIRLGITHCCLRHLSFHFHRPLLELHRLWIRLAHQKYENDLY